MSRPAQESVGRTKIQTALLSTERVERMRLLRRRQDSGKLEISRTHQSVETGIVDHSHRTSSPCCQPKECQFSTARFSVSGTQLCANCRCLGQDRFRRVAPLFSQFWPLFQSFTLKEFPSCQPRWCQFFGCVTARFRSHGAQFSSNCCRCHGLSRFRRVVLQFRCISRPMRAMSPSLPCHLEVWCSEKVMGLTASRRVDVYTQGKQSTLCVILGFMAVSN